MYDFERDIIRAKNPLNADFTFQYDSLPHTVAANSTKDMERYLFRIYLWNMIGHIYNQITEAKFDEFHDKFTRTHPDVIDDPYLLNEKIWLKLPRADNPEFQKKVFTDCMVGVVSKFGSNRQLPQQAKGQLDPNTPLFQSLINDYKTVGLIEESAPTPAATEPLPTAPATAEEITV